MIRYEEDSRKRRVCPKNEQNATCYDQYSQNAEIQNGLRPQHFFTQALESEPFVCGHKWLQSDISSYNMKSHLPGSKMKPRGGQNAPFSGSIR